jgi:carboxypeptidase C (cathepsin A)
MDQPASERTPDQPVYDTTAYGAGPDDSITDATERAAVTEHSVTIGGQTIVYTARAGHLVIYDQVSAQPTAKIFYVAFTKNDAAATRRPVTFFYNGGPGSSSVFLLLGSFGPRRIKTNMPFFTPPAPYTLQDNADSLIDRSDLVFINPVGTGYSAAIAPSRNRDFWGVDEDARAIKQFIKRYLTTYGRWNSPKFLFGESYGTPRTCVLTWLLHEDGVDLNGIVLQSSILDYAQPNLSVGIFPTFAADALFHGKAKVNPAPTDLPAYLSEVETFAQNAFAAGKATFPNVDPATLQTASDLLGIPVDLLKSWKFDPDINAGTSFLKGLLRAEGLAVGGYDGRVTANETGIADTVAPNAGANDPTLTAVGGVYGVLWNVLLNEELKYTSISPFQSLNNLAFQNWNFNHIDPTGAQVGGPTLYTAGDLAASMELNPYLKVFCANGYYDAVTPYLQTKRDLLSMPLGDPAAYDNLRFCSYPSGHMVYLDDASRTAMKADLAKFYDEILGAHAAMTASNPAAPRIRATRYRRSFGRTPY